MRYHLILSMFLYHSSIFDSSTDIYIYFGYANSCVQKMWTTKSTNMSITDDNVTFVGKELPEGANEIQIS